MTDRIQLNRMDVINDEGKKRLILIVEDDFINREILKAYLEQDYEILCAETGMEGLRLIHENSETLSLILLDLNLPEMNGMDILREIKKDFDLSRIPVIVLTSDTASEVESLDSGASDFIPKPYPRHEIVQARARRCIELSENRDLIRGTERDELTGLYNREYFNHYLEQYDHYHRDRPMDAMIVDISHFRLMNERFGRAYADEILKRIGAELFAFVREHGGLACRRQADMFLVYCPHLTDYAAFAERITDAACGGAKGRVRIRVGVCSEVDKTIEMERNFDHAKSASDTIRNSFTETVAVFNDELRSKEIYAERLLEDFHDAIAEKQFKVFYQPKFSLQSPKPCICGAEALVRWKHPEFGMVSPGQFIPLFESNGLIRDLDNYVWRETAAQIRSWKDRFGRSVPVSVNVSRIDMMDPELCDTLRSIVEENRLDYADLHLETTESAYTEDAGLIIRTVSRLREMGFVIEMDDFGSGYSSLNMITKVPFDVMKLDREFIRTAFSENENIGILRIMLDIAEFLSIPMIAEGVETEREMLALQALGCDMAQGYYFAKPMPANEFEEFLKDGTD